MTREKMYNKALTRDSGGIVRTLTQENITLTVTWEDTKSGLGQRRIKHDTDIGDYSISRTIRQQDMVDLRHVRV